MIILYSIIMKTQILKIGYFDFVVVRYVFFVVFSCVCLITMV